MAGRLPRVIVVALMAATACSPGGGPAESSAGASDRARPSTTAAPTAAPTAVPTAVPTVTPAPTPTVAPTPTPTVAPTPTPAPVSVRGQVVSALDGGPLAGTTVSAAGVVAVTGDDGRFELADIGAADAVSASRPAWETTTVELPDTAAPLVIELDPFVVRALRVSSYVAADPDEYADLLELVDETVVNALVFDTKDETDRVLYETDVELAHEIGSVDPMYDPADLLAEARSRDLYTITRIVTFEDATWARGVPGAALGGGWVDAARRANWDYPLDLAVEACELGFDEIQFDYIRFPAGRLSARTIAAVPATEAERVAAISGFLAEARSRLHDRGCGVSAAIFGIVMSSETDERLGQTPEAVSAVVDAVSPMVYPSHYSPGWLGYADPNDHPGPVVAHALDTGSVRMAPGSLLRPWLQGFYYNGAQVQAQIAEAEARGAGWIIWNASGAYGRSWLPSA